MFERAHQCQTCWFWSRKDGKKCCANKKSMYHNKTTHANEGCLAYEKKIKGKGE
jgi:hypothetical protein